MKQLILFLGLLVLIGGTFFTIKYGFTNDLRVILSSYSSYADDDKLEYIDMFRTAKGESIFDELNKIVIESTDDEEVMAVACYLVLTEGVSEKDLFCKKCKVIIAKHPNRLKPTIGPPNFYEIVNEFCELEIEN